LALEVDSPRARADDDAGQDADRVRMRLPYDDVERNVDKGNLQVGRRPGRVGLTKQGDLRQVLPPGRHLLLALADHAGEHVVVEVLADARKLDLRLDPVRRMF
jgi:hypothetical protein